MNNFPDLYCKTLAKNEEQLQHWQNHLLNLQSLDFFMYSDKLKVPILVPLGSKMLFRGELLHTNEVTFRLGTDYFVKCSASQAEVIRQHRIKVAESNVKAILEERELIEKQTSFITNTAFNGQVPEIFEEFSEEEDLKWRKKHRENLREYKQRNKTDKPEEKISDEELWFRLEKLELQEELELEVKNMDKVTKQIIKKNISKIRDPDTAPEDSHKTRKEGSINISMQDNRDVKCDNKKSNIILSDNNGTLSPKHTAEEVTVAKDKVQLDLLKEEEEENKGKFPSTFLEVLLTKLDEMEKLDELEDEMERLGHGLEDEDVEDSEAEVAEEQSSPAVEIKRSVSFADEDNSKTIQITFRHSGVEPDTTPFDEDEGISKPSDVYAAFSNLFNENKSILKKSKYERDYTPSGPRMEKRTKVDDFQEAEDNRRKNKTIVINDIVEKIDVNDNKFKRDPNIVNEDRPLSVFKKRRQENR